MSDFNKDLKDWFEAGMPLADEKQIAPTNETSAAMPKREPLTEQEIRERLEAYLQALWLDERRYPVISEVWHDAIRWMESRQ